MRRIAKVFSILIVGLFVLTGCGGEEEFESFSLHVTSDMDPNDEETPASYTVNHPEAKDQVVLIRSEKISPTKFDRSEERFDLENVTVTDEEITIEYDGQTETFSRLSESVAENEDGVWYQYTEN